MTTTYRRNASPEMRQCATKSKLLTTVFATCNMRKRKKFAQSPEALSFRLIW